MTQAIAPFNRTQSAPPSVGNTTYINALPEDASSAIALGVLLVHYRTGEERILDILIENDDYATYSAVVRQYFSLNWIITESFPLDEDKVASLSLSRYRDLLRAA